MILILQKNNLRIWGNEMNEHAKNRERLIKHQAKMLERNLGWAFNMQDCSKCGTPRDAAVYIWGSLAKEKGFDQKEIEVGLYYIHTAMDEDETIGVALASALNAVDRVKRESEKANYHIKKDKDLYIYNRIIGYITSFLK